MLKLAVVLLVSTWSVSAEASCFQIRDPDLKRSCRALNQLEDGDVGMARSHAGQIRDRDQQKRIRAIISAASGDRGMARSHCYSIRNRDEKNACLARIER